jgi:glycosyltransferase involved in cell wall biosynthesis
MTGEGPDAQPASVEHAARRMRVSVVLTTHDRPALLVESIGSVLAQTSEDWELVVVDDGSAPPVTLPERVLVDNAARVTLVRHATARGPSEARNSGVAAARGEVVTFLDDDDVLAPSAVAEIADAFDAGIDCLFVTVGCFGSLAAGTLENQQAAMQRVLLEATGSPHPGSRVVRFQPEPLFRALLHRVPMTFQRVAIRRESFARIGPYRGVGFADIEWYYRAVLRSRTALLDRVVYLVRCEGQSFFSRRDAVHRLSKEVIQIREAAAALPEVQQSRTAKREVQRALARAHFESCWSALQQGASFPWRSFVSSPTGHRAAACEPPWQGAGRSVVHPPVMSARSLVGAQSTMIASRPRARRHCHRPRAQCRTATNDDQTQRSVRKGSR